MGKPILCAGNRAKTPYFFEKKMVNLYSIEELCFCLMQDAYLIDQDIMSKSLVDWIHTECGMTELSGSLYTLLNQKGTASAFVSLILEYTCMYDRERIEETLAIIRDNANLNQYEKGKAKADYFLDQKKYQVAIAKYLELLDEIPETEKPLIASILYNMGNAYAGLFQFKLAAASYRKSYGLMGGEDALIRYLLSVRLYLSESDYLKFVTEHPEVYPATDQVERLLSSCSGRFEMTEEYRMLFTMKVCREDGSDAAGNVVPYYREVERQTDLLKEAYREMVAR